MKTFFFSIILLFINFSTQAQDKNARGSIEVDGVCMMCKERIEKGAIKTKGVKSAVWDVKTHELSLIFDERKTSLEKIEERVAAVGHDTPNHVAATEVYDKLHPCCKYRDEEVIKDHH